MLRAEFQAGFPWGVLLITDAESKEEIPSWATADDQVAVAATALAVRVMHEDDGEVAVRVLDDDLRLDDAQAGRTHRARGVVEEIGPVLARHDRSLANCRTVIGR